MLNPEATKPGFHTCNFDHPLSASFTFIRLDRSFSIWPCSNDSSYLQINVNERPTSNLGVKWPITFIDDRLDSTANRLLSFKNIHFDTQDHKGSQKTIHFHYRSLSSAWTVHYYPLIHSDRSFLSERPSIPTYERPLWLKRPSTIVLDRPLWLKTVHFARPSTFIFLDRPLWKGLKWFSKFKRVLEQ